MNIVSWVVNRVRTLGSRFSYMASRAFGTLYYGTMVSFTYLNFKHDPTPMIFVMYSGMRYTHGINLHYMSNDDKMWFGRMIYLLKKGNQVIDGRTLYQMIKMQRPSIIRRCYRMYFTQFIQNPRMVSAGFTALGKLQYQSEDPFIQALNAQLTPEYINRSNVRVSYYPEELKDRIIMAQQAIPIQSGTRSATTPIQSATRGQDNQV